MIGGRWLGEGGRTVGVSSLQLRPSTRKQVLVPHWTPELTKRGVRTGSGAEAKAKEVFAYK